MFEIVLAISVLTVLTGIALYRVDFAVVIFLVSLGVLASTPFLYASARSLFLIYPALFTTWFVCRRRNVSRTAFAAFATLSVAAAWSVALALFLPRWKEAQRLATDYPVVRIDERLDYEKGRSLPAEESARHNAAVPSDAEIEETTGVHYPWNDRRGSALAVLERTHKSYVDAFIEQEEFGFIRMIHMPPRDEYIRLAEPEPIPMPSAPSEATSAGVSEATNPVAVTEPFQKFHAGQALEFSNPQGFGQALDGTWERFTPIGATQVRGFQPHAFRSIPQGSPAGDDWQLAKLELVSLLKHDPPAVYLSKHLPRMQELAADDSPTRPIDAFESAALVQLNQGKILVAEESRNRIRAFGALRAAEKCMQCHRVLQGELLGAFTYEFRRKTPLPPAKEPPQEAAKPEI